MADEFIDLQKSLYPDLADKYEVLGVLQNSKLWHQLSVGLEGFIKDVTNHRGNNIFELYTEFISKCEGRLSQIRVALLASMVAQLYTEPAKALEFLEKVLLARNRLGTEASLCLDMDVVIVKLKLGQTKDAKEALEAAKEKTQSLQSKEPVIFSRFFMATAEYRKCVGPPQEFYKAALMYLAYTPIEDLTATQRYTLATDMALASITGDDIFNFGEVIATPILSSLAGKPNGWLQDLVLALHKGDIDNFNLIVDSYKTQYFAQPSLAAKHEEIKKKVVLLCLLNIAFERPSHDRTIPFAVIAAKTRIPIDQVEWVCMRAMSLGLLKGSIDEVDQTISVTWVQPRVLDREQLSLLSIQLDGWTEKVKTALVTIEDQTPELYV
mmetsp:Transcript_25632/g.24492  ORF Transcript_25632/g.24492 Transcript_25632/m.24492 type:complete len:381 (-) Transcript_25632:92-1234(-)